MSSHLVVFSGLPGVGKTVLSQRLAEKLRGIYIRIDSIEQAMKPKYGILDETAYLVGYQLAQDNLKLGGLVVVDAVNSCLEARNGWRISANMFGSKLTEVLVVCSDKSEHKKRVDKRVADIEGHILPSWTSVQNLAFEGWDLPPFIIDTAKCTVSEGVNILMQEIN